MVSWPAADLLRPGQQHVLEEGKYKPSAKGVEAHYRVVNIMRLWVSQDVRI